MRLGQGRTGWALLAAGGMALSAAAQVTPPPAAAEKAVVAALAETSATIDEIRVELAWLADPATFPCQLAARVTGGALEVGGMVPSAGLRQRAIEVAKKETGLDVVDKLIVRPGSTLPVARANQENLCKAATGALTNIFVKFSETFEVMADPAGQVTVSGIVPSHEDKLKISRRLSMLPGCASVVNKLSVKQDIASKADVVTKIEPAAVFVPPMQFQPAPAVTRVEQTTIVVPQQPAQARTPIFPVQSQPLPTQVKTPTFPVQNQPQPAQAKSLSFPVQNQPQPAQATQAVPAIIKTQSQPAQPAQPTSPVSKAPAQPAPTYDPNQWSAVASKIDPTMPKPSFGQPIALPPVTQTARTASAVQPVAAVMPAVAAAPALAPLPVIINQNKAPQPLYPAPVIINLQPASPVSPYAHSKPSQTGMSSNALVAGPKVSSQQAVGQAQNQGVTQVVYRPEAMNSPTIVQASAGPSPCGAAVRSSPTTVPASAKPELNPTIPGRPLDQYRPTNPVQPMTLGNNTVVFQNSPAMPKAQPSAIAPAMPMQTVVPAQPPAIAPASPKPMQPTPTFMQTPPNSLALQGQLQQRIQATCGSAASDIQVIKQADDRFLVRLRLRNPADGDRVAQKVLEIPELAPYQVDLEVRQGQ